MVRPSAFCEIQVPGCGRLETPVAHAESQSDVDPIRFATNPHYAPPQDAIRERVNLIVGGGYDRVEDIATGRFLNRIGHIDLHTILPYLNFDAMRRLRSRPGWVMVEVPYHPPKGGEWFAHLRFLKFRYRWFLEHIRIVEKVELPHNQP